MWVSPSHCVNVFVVFVWFDRYIEALQAQMKERIVQEKVELPHLCWCGDSFWDSHPDTCANNCVFYNNPKGTNSANIAFQIPFRLLPHVVSTCSQVYVFISPCGLSRFNVKTYFVAHPQSSLTWLWQAYWPLEWPELHANMHRWFS